MRKVEGIEDTAKVLTPLAGRGEENSEASSYLLLKFKPDTIQVRAQVCCSYWTT
jgi:hypothetical protein